MTISDLPLPATHRPDFFAGELLHARDLSDLVALERSLRWLHNRVLHGWGIGLGLTVDGAPGAKLVSVGAGYALDAAGRDLVLEQAVTLPVPPVATGPDGGPASYLLVLSYTEDAEAIVDLRDGACATVGAVRRQDDPTVAWRLPTAVRDGLDIVLAAATVSGCALAKPLVTDGVRRGLGAIPSPHIATGLDYTAWDTWTQDGQAVGVTATVDTSAAGFGDTPAYQLTIVGPRLMTVGGSSFLVDGNPYVARAGMLSFDVVVALPAGLVGGLDVNPPAHAPFADAVTELGWRVQWLGVETT